jgi:hypothetical protein
MWPKMLLEFLPHLTRLIPAADNYFGSRKESDKAQQAAVVSLADEVRGSFAKLAEEQAVLRRELQTYAANSAQVGIDAARARMGVESLESRLAQVEKGLTNTARLLWTILVTLGSVLLLVALRTLR